MNNWHFGDVNDYHKYGLLRAIQSVTEFQILVAWMLASDESPPNYLSKPKKWREFDPELFDQLQSFILQSMTGNVNLIEQFNLLPRTRYYNEVIDDDRQNRLDWINGLLMRAERADLVFLDPDNGLEVQLKLGTKGSTKYVYWEEVEKLWHTGVSLLIYQHYPIHQKREEFISRISTDLGEHTKGSDVQVFKTPHMCLLLAMQPGNKRKLYEICEKVKETWKNQIIVWKFST